jgi:molybdopterin converting factor small subunit
MITVRVLFFSTIRARIGKKNIQIELPVGARVMDLKNELALVYPDAAATIMNMMASVDRVYSDDNTELNEESEVAFFPYVTGG